MIYTPKQINYSVMIQVISAIDFVSFPFLSGKESMKYPCHSQNIINNKEVAPDIVHWKGKTGFVNGLNVIHDYLFIKNMLLFI